MSKTYTWRPGGPKPPVDANIFGAVKDEIEAKKGIVTPYDIVQEAKKPSSPIHAALEWNNSIAARHHRIEQARHLLGSLQIVHVRMEVSPTISSKAMFRVRPEHSSGGYASQDRILSDRDLRRQVIASARSELECFVKKYAGILAMGTVNKRLQDVIDEITDHVEQLEVDANRRRPGRPSIRPDGSPDAPAP
jgi:hypothetical protein